MGQKVNPTGFRTGIMVGWKSRWYAPKQEFSNLLIEDRKLPDGGILGLRVDITEMKEQALALARAAEAAEAANRAKSEFLANISHEIRTPLHGILGMAQVLARDEALGEEQRSRVALIRQSGQALLELLNDRIRSVEGVVGTETIMYLSLRKQTYQWGTR